MKLPSTTGNIVIRPSRMLIFQPLDWWYVLQKTSKQQTTSNNTQIRNSRVKKQQHNVSQPENHPKTTHQHQPQRQTTTTTPPEATPLAKQHDRQAEATYFARYTVGFMPQGWDNKLVMTFCNANKRAWELEGTGHKMLTPPSVDPNMEPGEGAEGERMEGYQGVNQCQAYLHVRRKINVPNSITPETDNGCLEHVDR